MAGRRETGGLSWVGEDRLIPLKAVAWLELSERKQQGEPVDAKSIRKHVNDVLRLSQLLAPETQILVAPKIANDMLRFLQAAALDSSLDPQSLGLGRTGLAEIFDRLGRAYGLEGTVGFGH